MYRRNLNLMDWNTRNLSELPGIIGKARFFNNPNYSTENYDPVKLILQHKLNKNYNKIHAERVTNVEFRNIPIKFRYLLTLFISWLQSMTQGLKQFQSIAGTRRSFYVIQHEIYYFQTVCAYCEQLFEKLAELCNCGTKSFFTLEELPNCVPNLNKRQREAMHQQVVNFSNKILGFLQSLSVDAKHELVTRYSEFGEEANTRPDAKVGQDIVYFAFIAALVKQEKDQRSVEQIMEDLGIEEDKPSVIPKPVRKKKKRVETPSSSSQPNIQPTVSMPAHPFTNIDELDAQTFQEVVRRKRHQSLRNMLTKYYRVNALQQPFNMFKVPRVNKPYGSVLVYNSNKYPYHLSIAPGNLPIGFHLTQGTNRYYYKGDDFTYATRNSHQTNLTPSSELSQLAKKFAVFLKHAQK